MGTIYTPRGKAREYSPKALNIYLKCSHGCRYCYAPSARFETLESYTAVPEPRKDIAKKLDAELGRERVAEQVLLSFIGDVYCETADHNAATRECLEVLLSHKVPVAILTKGGKRSLKDVDLFKSFGEHIQVGATLTLEDDADSLYWEPHAASTSERMEALKTLHGEGIRTFVSFEPVIDPSQTLSLIERCLGFVDVFKVGKLNHNKEIEEKVDWTAFLESAVAILRGAGKPFYVKHDLRKAAPSVKLYGNEVLADEHNVS